MLADTRFQKYLKGEIYNSSGHTDTHQNKESV